MDQFFCSTLLFLGVFYRLSLALGRNNPFIPWYNLCIQTIRIIFYSSFYVERFLLKLFFPCAPISPNIHISKQTNYRANCRRRTKGRPFGWKEGRSWVFREDICVWLGYWYSPFCKSFSTCTIRIVAGTFSSSSSRCVNQTTANKTKRMMMVISERRNDGWLKIVSEFMFSSALTNPTAF